MIVREVCKRCKCTNWIFSIDNKETICANCNYTKCSAHKWFIPCGRNELEIKENHLEYFIGDIKDYGLEDDYLKNKEISIMNKENLKKLTIQDLKTMLKEKDRLLSTGLKVDINLLSKPSPILNDIRIIQEVIIEKQDEIMENHKEILLELLDKYEQSEGCVINDRGALEDYDELEEEIKQYKNRYICNNNINREKTIDNDSAISRLDKGVICKGKEYHIPPGHMTCTNCNLKSYVWFNGDDIPCICGNMLVSYNNDCITVDNTIIYEDR